MHVRALVVAALAAALTACSTTVPGTPVPAAPKLDTGNYPTTPRTITAVNPADAWQQESWNIGDYVVAPWDIEPAFTRAAAADLKPQPLNFAPFLLNGRPFTPQQTARLESGTLQAGYRTRWAGSDDGKFTIGTGILRFSTPDTAAAAVRSLTSSPAPVMPPGLRSLPGTSVLQSAADGTTVYTATPRGNLVILADVTGAPTPQRAMDLLTKAIPAQLSRADGYRQSSYTGGIPKVDMDPRGAMSRTIPAGSDPQVKELSDAAGLSSGFTMFAGARTRHASVLFSGGKKDLDSIQGIDLIASAGGLFSSSVYLMESDAAAREVRVLEGSDTGCVPGLPADTVSCAPDQNDDARGCAISYGRWVSVTAAKTAPLLAQRCSAQYLIMRAAGPG